jgi:hypothetical protein
MTKKKTDKQLEKAMSSIANLLNGMIVEEEKKKK